MVEYLPRSAWNARQSKGAVALIASEVIGNALHWPGMSKSIDAVGDAGKERVASALRGWQTYHMDVKGWSDIAYQIAVDQVGRAWTLRGLNIRSAANGSSVVNHEYGAILLILGPGEQPSSAMKETVGGVLADFRRRYIKCPRRPKGHRDVRPEPTDCPGAPAYSAIQRGEFDATETPEPPTIPGDTRPRNSKNQLAISYTALMTALSQEVSDQAQAYVDSAMASLKFLGFGTAYTEPYSQAEFRATWYSFVDAIDASQNRYAFEYFVDRCGFWPPDRVDWPTNAWNYDTNTRA